MGIEVMVIKVLYKQIIEKGQLLRKVVQVNKRYKLTWFESYHVLEKSSWMDGETLIIINNKTNTLSKRVINCNIFL